MKNYILNLIIYKSILHINVDAPFTTFEQAWEMLNWIASKGVTYFAFNGKINQCEEFHGFYSDYCPACGKPKVRTFTRSVGYYTPIDTWSTDRAAEFQLRKWMPLNEKGANA